MAYTLTLPFFAFRLRLHSGGSYLSPLLDSEVLHTNGPLEVLAGKYANAFQSKVLDKGDLSKLLDEGHTGPFYKDQLKVDFKEAKDGFSFPAFSLDFDFYYSAGEKGVWGVIPVLGLESFAQDLVALEKSLFQAVRLEFARKHRLKSVHQIISAIWFDTTELLSHAVNVKFYTPRELEKIQEERQELLLPKIAKRLEIKERVVYEYKEEVEQLVRAVKNKFTHNVVLVGPTGVGKTALVWELAHQSKKRRINFHIWETTASVMIKELTGDTGWQDNLAFLCQELAGSNNVLFVRNLLELFEVGQYSGNEVSMAEYLRSYISRGDIYIISECSEEERARIELRAPNFLSYFQIVQIEEPKKNLEKIVLHKASDLAKNRGLVLAEEAIKESIRLHRRFQPYSGFPGKPIRFLESIILNQHHTLDSKIGRAKVIRNFCEETGMPAFMVDPEVLMEPSKIMDQFNTQVFGQEVAVASVVDTLSTVKTALSRTGKPIASFLFVGPTGVGKTELAKVLSEFMFSTKERMVRFDMSEYSDPYSVMRLLGESFFTDGLLTSAVRREPFCVLLFDEIEKAHPSFYDLLLQILGEGRLTDSRGKLVNFCSTIIIMTSNIGAGGIQQNKVAFKDTQSTEELTQHFRKAVEKHFRPELFNRIDKVIPFKPLSKETVRFVVDREIDLMRLREGIRFRNMDLHLQEEVLDHLAERGYDPKYGARQLQRYIQDGLLTPLAKKLNLLEYDDKVVVDVGVGEQGGLDIEVESDPMGLDLLMEELDKINYTDHSSALRRDVSAFKEGHFYNRLSSQLDILEREKSKNEKRFWQNGPKSAKYNRLLKNQETLELLIQEIEDIEEQLSRACLGQGAFDESLIDQIKAWEEKIKEYKLDLYFQHTPEGNSVYLNVYGNPVQTMMDFYVAFFAKKSFNWEAHTIWFREAYYNEEIAVTIRGEEVVKRREAYIKKKFVEGEKNNFKPLAKGDLLYGLSFEVEGKGAALYLKDESGLYRWKENDKETYNYQVIVNSEKPEDPPNIHRRDFYRGTPRRIMEPNFFKDSAFKIKRELNRKLLMDTLIEILDKEFWSKLDAELV